MKEITKIGLILLLITAVAGVILGVSNAVTSEKIAEIEKLLIMQQNKRYYKKQKILLH